MHYSHYHWKKNHLLPAVLEGFFKRSVWGRFIAKSGDILYSKQHTSTGTDLGIVCTGVFALLFVILKNLKFTVPLDN
jgi:hypothetical protein